MIGKVFLKRGLLLLIALLAVLAMTAMPAFAAARVWQPVGSADFSPGETQGESLFVYNGTPYVAYTDYANDAKATVMEYTGVTTTNTTGWTSVGSPGFSAGGADHVSLYVYNGTPYVAYEDMNTYNGNATVMEYTGGSWVDVGSPGFSSNEATYESLYVYNGTPYLAYADGACGGTVTAMVYSNSGATGWTAVGSPGFSGSSVDNMHYTDYESLFVYDNNGTATPYVAYYDYNGGYPRASVMEYTGGSWGYVGSQYISAGEADYTSLYVYDGTPYVAYSDFANGGNATVMEYTDGSWMDVGSPDFSSGRANFTSLYVYDGTPYVAYEDGSYFEEDLAAKGVKTDYTTGGGQATVMEYTGGSWVDVGSPDFSNDGAVCESLFVYDGTPYVAYSDNNIEARIATSAKSDSAGDVFGQATVMEAVAPATAPPSPSFSLTSGIISVSETLGIGSITTGDAAYYTITGGTSGTMPTVNSSLYSQPFTVSTTPGTYTVEAAVFDSGTGLWSNPTTAIFTVWGISPHGGSITTSQTVGINLPQPPYSVALSPMTSTFSVERTVYYTITEGSAGTMPTVSSSVYSQPFIVSATPGTYTVEAAVYSGGIEYSYEGAALSNNLIITSGFVSTDTATFTIPAPSIVSTIGGGGGGGGIDRYPPSVQTEAASSITAASAALNGDITSDNGFDVTDYGFLWGASAGGLTSKLDVGTDNHTGAFTDTLSSLTAGTAYYFEAYATNSQGTSDGAVLSFTTTGTAQTTTPTFSDVPSSNWAYNAITSLSTQGYVYGYPDGAFQPDKPITRAEVAVIMDKALNLMPYTPQSPTFTDVNPGDWFDQAVETANRAGIEIGYHDGTFRPNNPISREEFACVLVQALGKADLANSYAQTATKYTDDHDIAWWSRGFVFVGTQQGILSGYTDNTFEPAHDTTRAEACAMIINFLNVYK